MTKKNFLLAKIEYKRSRRGTREMDILLHNFNNDVAHEFTDDQWVAYDELLDLSDQEILDVIHGSSTTDNPILLKLKEFASKPIL